MTVRLNWFIPVNTRNYNRMPASVWIRCLQLIPYLKEQGIQSVVNDPDTDADVSVFVRWQDEHAYELACQQKRRGQRIVFDLVVNYFDKASVPYLGKPTTQKHVDDVLRMLSVADVVICSSNNIARRARKFHSWVEYLSDSIDSQHFRLVKPAQDFRQRKLRAIWGGIVTKACELEPILPLLQQYDIELVIISNKRPRLNLADRFAGRRFRYRFLRWRYRTFPRHILEGEICVVHRSVDNPYNRGHSLFKIGAFMAQGVPAVVSPVPSYLEVLGNGFGGCVCYSTDEWKAILGRILGDRDCLVEWSQQAREAVEPYSTERIVERYKELFMCLCG